jgi:transposase
MQKLNLKDKEIKELKRLHKQMSHKQSADRLKVVIALAKGYTYAQIEEILLIDERSSRRYKKLFLEGGIDLLFSYKYQGRKSKLTPEQEHDLCEHLKAHLYSSAKEIARHIFKTYDVKYTSDGLVIMLKRLGFSYKKTANIPCKADKELQETFVARYEALRGNLKSNEELFFLDAVHPTHNTMPAYAWIEKGKEKQVKSNTGRQRININGVYSPVSRTIIYREDKKINAQSTINLFKTIEEKQPYLKKIYIISDNARYYYSKDVKEYLKNSKIELINLPAYSPNLNLIERLWKFFKKKILYNQYYATFQDFKEAVFDFFDNKIHGMKKELAGLMTERFQILEAE